MTSAAQPLSAMERAAVVVMLLEEAQAATLLAQLDPDELDRLAERMCSLGEIGPAAITESIAQFADQVDRPGLSAHGRGDQVRSLMDRAVGSLKADQLMQRAAAAPDSAIRPSLAILRWLNPDVLVRLVSGEHPQAIAALLLQLEPEVAAQVLSRLPAPLQPDVVHRIATFGVISPDALDLLGAALQQRIEQVHGAPLRPIGGPAEAAEILNRSGKQTERRIMPEMTKRDRQLARAIEERMFRFEHLFTLDPLAMGALLREVDSESLIAALKGIADDQREVFFAAMSSRAADGLRDEIAALGRLKLSDVAEAQRAIIAVARRLAADGVISFGAGADDEYV